MLNIDNLPIEIRCPLCSFYNTVSLKQIRLRDVIICRGCKSNIQLEDYMNECRKTERKIRESIHGMQKSLKDLNIEIHI